MSPEIRINGQLIADVPDETGLHQMLDGSPLYVDVSGISTWNGVQTIILESPVIGGCRVVNLTHEGIGTTKDRKRKNDQQDPLLYVTLHHRPIRHSYRYTEQVWHDSRDLATPRGGQWITVDRKRTRYNPRWSR